MLSCHPEKKYPHRNSPMKISHLLATFPFEMFELQPKNRQSYLVLTPTLCYITEDDFFVLEGGMVDCPPGNCL